MNEADKRVLAEFDAQFGDMLSIVTNLVGTETLANAIKSFLLKKLHERV